MGADPSARGGVPGTLLVVGVRSLGREIAAHFARQGWAVCCAARTASDVAAVAAEVDAAGGTGLGVVADLNDAASLHALVEKAAAVAGRIDLVVAAHTSGAKFGPVPVLGLRDEDLQLRFSGSLLAGLHLLQAAAPRLAEQGGGTFVQIGTGSGLQPRDGFAALGATQAALRALVLSAARELAGQNIHAAYLAVAGQIESAKSKAYIERVGLERCIPPVEVARAVEFLHRQDARAWTDELCLRPRASLA